MTNSATPMSSFRLVTWNCRSGSVTARVSELAEYSPDLVFLQECDPAATLPFHGEICRRRINTRKAIALLSPCATCCCSELVTGLETGGAAVVATVTAPSPFTVVGIWAQAPHYVSDVVRTLDAHPSLLQSGPAVVMGDFNSGHELAGERVTSPGHRRLLDRFAELNLVSTYHAFHRAEHGQEIHPTHFHQFNPLKPWHIDFCFVSRSWLPHLADVRILEGAEWKARSDHRPLVVEIRIP